VAVGMSKVLRPIAVLLGRDRLRKASRAAWTNAPGAPARHALAD
jgi:hypothetical protein